MPTVVVAAVAGTAALLPSVSAYEAACPGVVSAGAEVGADAVGAVPAADSSCGW